MTRTIGNRIKDLKTTLKELEPMVKHADMYGRPFLLNGNNLAKKNDRIGIDDGGVFDMRRREAWINWLICAVLNEAIGGDFTFQEVKDRDGIIVDRKTGNSFLFEHVLAMNPPKTPGLHTVDELIIEAVNKKIKKDIDRPGYAKDTHLAVFVYHDQSGEWHPGKVAQNLNGKHPFNSIYCASLVSATPDGGHNYSVTCIGENGAISYLVEINSSFTSWKVKLITWKG